MSGLYFTFHSGRIGDVGGVWMFITLVVSNDPGQALLVPDSGRQPGDVHDGPLAVLEAVLTHTHPPHPRHTLQGQGRADRELQEDGNYQYISLL